MSSNVPIAAPPIDPAGYVPRMRSAYEDRYGRGRDSWTREEAMRAAAPILAEHLAGRPGARVLDVGAGRGRDSALLLERGFRVTGLDLVATAEWAELARRYGERVRFEATAFLSFAADAPFDGVLDNGCFHHQHPDDYATYLAKIVSLLAPEGVVTLSVFLCPQPTGSLELAPDGGLYRYFAPPELHALCAGAGLALVGQTEVPRRIEDWVYYVATYRRAPR